MFIPEIKQLQDLLTSFLGQSKNDVNENGQLQFNCPKCIEDKGNSEYGKYNLEINIFKGVYKCWSCGEDGMKGPIKSLIKKYGNPEILRDYERILNDIRNNSLYKLPELEGLLTIIEQKYLTLPSTFTKIKDINKTKKQVKEYLLKRKITQDIIDKFNIGYTEWDDNDYKCRNRIIIPSYDAMGNLNYWVGRDFTGKSLSKYYNCVGVKKTEIVFQESNINFDADITLVEGAIDCIYGNNTISLLGKTLSPNDEITKTLFEKANANIIICLDNDTDISEIKRIYQVLNKGRLKGHIRYIKLENFKDFGEAYEFGGKQEIINVLKTQKDFDIIDLI